MKLINYLKEEKEYNGNRYNEYTLRLADGTVNRLVKVTGRIPVVLITAEGELTDAGRLDQCGLTAGDELTFWFDLKDRISQIDVHVSAPAEPMDDIIVF